MKRRVEAARARVQASAQATPNRREAFSSSISGRGEDDEESEAAAAEERGARKEKAADELAPPIPVVPAAQAAPPEKVTAAERLPLPEGVSLSELEGANKTVWTTLGEASGLKAWARKWSAARETGGQSEEADSAAAANKKQPGSDWNETMFVLTLFHPPTTTTNR